MPRKPATPITASVAPIARTGTSPAHMTAMMLTAQIAVVPKSDCVMNSAPSGKSSPTAIWTRN